VNDAGKSMDGARVGKGSGRKTKTAREGAKEAKVREESLREIEARFLRSSSFLREPSLSSLLRVPQIFFVKVFTGRAEMTDEEMVGLLSVYWFVTPMAGVRLEGQVLRRCTDVEPNEYRNARAAHVSIGRSDQLCELRG
jgi:hypothetical protein